MDLFDSPTLRTSLPKLGIDFHCTFPASPTGLASKLLSVSGSSCIGQAPSFLGLLRERPFNCLPQRNCNCCQLFWLWPRTLVYAKHSKVFYECAGVPGRAKNILCSMRDPRVEAAGTFHPQSLHLSQTCLYWHMFVEMGGGCLLVQGGEALRVARYCLFPLPSGYNLSSVYRVNCPWPEAMLRAGVAYSSTPFLGRLILDFNYGHPSYCLQYQEVPFLECRSADSVLCNQETLNRRESNVSMPLWGRGK